MVADVYLQHEICLHCLNVNFSGVDYKSVLKIFMILSNSKKTYLWLNVQYNAIPRHKFLTLIALSHMTNTPLTMITIGD